MGTQVGGGRWSWELQGWDPGVAGVVFLLSQGNICPNELMHVLVFESSTVTYISINNNDLSSAPSS